MPKSQVRLWGWTCCTEWAFGVDQHSMLKVHSENGWTKKVSCHVVSNLPTQTSLVLYVYIYIYIYLPEKGGDESQPLA